MTRKIMAVVGQVPDNHGLGVFYWDATWTAVTGNGWDPTDPSSGYAWENQALFDRNSHVCRPSLSSKARKGSSRTACETRKSD